MKHLLLIFILIGNSLFNFPLQAQKYIGIEYGFQHLNFHSRTYYGDWAMNSKVYEGIPPMQFNLNHVKTFKNKFQWHTGIQYRQYFMSLNLTDYQKPNPGNTMIIEKNYGIAQLGIPFYINYQIFNSESIKLRPFVGFNLNKDFCLSCNSNFNAYVNQSNRSDDPIESYLDRNSSGFINIKGNGMQANILFGIHTDFEVGKKKANVFRISFAKGFDIWGVNNIQWNVSYFGNSETYYPNWSRMNYTSIQFSYLHQIGAE